MKKKELKEKVEGLRKISNTLTGTAKDFADAVVAAFDEAADDSEEHEITDLKNAIDEIAARFDEKDKEVAEKIARAKQDMLKQLSNGVDQQQPKLTKKVANEIARAILRSAGREDIRNQVEKVLKRNDITGLEYNAIVDYTIELKVEELNPLWNAFHRTMFNKFYYSQADLTNASHIAKQWDKTSELEKKIQQLSVTAKSISTDYIYKRQRAAFKDLDEIEEAGQLSEFLTWISNELYQLIIDTIVMAVLVGDNVNEAGDKITTFETIGTKTTSDAFTTVVNVADLETATSALAKFAAAVGATSDRDKAIATLRYASDKIYNPRGKEKWAVLNSETLTALAAYRYADGGDITFRSREEVAALLGVDRILTSDLMAAGMDTAGVQAIFLLPDGYHVKEVKSLDFAYPTYEKNVQNFQKEVNAGGAIHDLLSTSVVMLSKSEEGGE